MAEKSNGFNAGGLFAGDNGKAFFDWIGQNQRAQEIFTGLLEEFGKGMGLQNQVAQVQLGNAAVAAAGFRPGQYVSARQRREAVLAATDPDEAAADKLARLQFHGGMANGKWTNNYDEWKAASKNGHGTNSEGEEIKTKSFGFSIPVARRDPKAVEAWKQSEAGQRARKFVVDSSKEAGGDYRSVRLNADGSLTYRFGDDLTSRKLAARRRLEMINNTDPANGPWLPDTLYPMESQAPTRDFLGGLFSASKGGETMRDRGWLDAVFARAERAAVRGGRTRR